MCRMHHTGIRRLCQRLLSCATGPTEASLAPPYCDGFLRKSLPRLPRICSAGMVHAHTTDGMFLLAVINGFTMVDAQRRARMRENPNDAIALGGV